MVHNSFWLKFWTLTQVWQKLTSHWPIHPEINRIIHKCKHLFSFKHSVLSSTFLKMMNYQPSFCSQPNRNSPNLDHCWIFRTCFSEPFLNRRSEKTYSQQLPSLPFFWQNKFVCLQQFFLLFKSAKSLWRLSSEFPSSCVTQDIQ